ncbi:hypothetical protein Tco_0040618 [Tanacetum coccineum]
MDAYWTVQFRLLCLLVKTNAPSGFHGVNERGLYHLGKKNVVVDRRVRKESEAKNDVWIEYGRSAKIENRQHEAVCENKDVQARSLCQHKIVAWLGPRSVKEWRVVIWLLRGVSDKAILPS